MNIKCTSKSYNKYFKLFIKHLRIANPTKSIEHNAITTIGLSNYKINQPEKNFKKLRYTR